MAFLGGPLHFLTELKAAFIRTLKLDDEHAITPENSHLFAAIGSALNYKEDVITSLSALIQKLSGTIHMEFEVARMDPLFASQEEYDAFRARHDGHNVKSADLSTYEGNCNLGRRGRFPFVFFLQQQQRKSACDGNPFHQGDLYAPSTEGKDRSLLLHRIR